MKRVPFNIYNLLFQSEDTEEEEESQSIIQRYKHKRIHKHKRQALTIQTFLTGTMETD